MTIKKILHHRVLIALIGASLILVVGGALWAVVTLGSSGSGSFILHFNDIDDITSVGGIGTIVFMGVVGLFITLVNGAIAFELDLRDPFLGKMTGTVTLIFAILLFISFAGILNVN